MAALAGLFLGALLGNHLWPDWGAIVGGLAGFFTGAFLTGQRQRSVFRKPDVPASGLPPSGMDARLAALERRVAQLEAAAAMKAGDAMPDPTAALAGAATGAGWVAAAPVEASAEAPAMPRETAPAPDQEQPRAPAPDLELPRVPTPDRAVAPPAGAMPPSAPGAPHRSPPPNPLWAWFTGGNAMTRIGVIVLFFGVAFLLRYFAEHFTIPVAVRLVAVAALGAALIVVGRRLARSRPAYGWALQGAGTGVLYLTTFAAYRLFDLLPPAVALALLALVAALTVWLALIADAQALGALALAGAFLAPALTDADRSPLPTFAYFALVNGVVLMLATRRAWRVVSVAGFLFTAVLALWWARHAYRPGDFGVLEFFLVLHLAMYVAIVLLQVRADAAAQTAPLDGVLVFGAPVTAFAFQAAVLGDTRYGAAWSALVLGAAFAALALFLRRSAIPGWQLLARLYTGLAVVFASLSIPFAFDQRVTAALWAIEGALVFWLGLGQRIQWVRILAVLLQAAAGVLFFVYGTAGDDDRVFANAFFMGAAMVALAGFATVRLADRDAAVLAPVERAAVPLVFAWSGTWWLGAGGVELVRQLPSAQEPHAILAWIASSVLAGLGVAQRLAWPRAVLLAIALPAAMLLVAVLDVERMHTTLLRAGWLVWPLAWVSCFLALRFADTLPPVAGVPRRDWQGNAHALAAVALVAQVAWEASEWTGRITAPDAVWVACAAAFPAIVYLGVTASPRADQWWPIARYRSAYGRGAGSAIAFFLVLWVVAVNMLSPGEPYPLPYVVLLNPLDLALASALFVLLRWSVAHDTLDERRRFVLLGAGIFLSINGAILRVGHHWGAIPWDLPALLASRPLQASLTLAWTVTGVALMIAAGRRSLRVLWMVGAALLALAIVKLFLVDLGALAGLPRVVAFLGAGALLLLIGYVSPLPPAGKAGPQR